VSGARGRGRELCVAPARRRRLSPCCEPPPLALRSRAGAARPQAYRPRGRPVSAAPHPPCAADAPPPPPTPARVAPLHLRSRCTPGPTAGGRRAVVTPLPKFKSAWRAPSCRRAGEQPPAAGRGGAGQGGAGRAAPPPAGKATSGAARRGPVRAHRSGAARRLRPGKRPPPPGARARARPLAARSAAARRAGDAPPARAPRLPRPWGQSAGANVAQSLLDDQKPLFAPSPPRREPPMARDAFSLPSAGPAEAGDGLQDFIMCEDYFLGGDAPGGGLAARGPSPLHAPAPRDAAPAPASADSSWWVVYARFGAVPGGRRARDAAPEKRFSARTTGIDRIRGRRRRDGYPLGAAGDLPGASDRPGARRGGSAGAARPGRCARRPLRSAGAGAPPAAPPPPPPPPARRAQLPAHGAERSFYPPSRPPTQVCPSAVGRHLRHR
jgi:hypothetical protein